MLLVPFLGRGKGVPKLEKKHHKITHVTELSPKHLNCCGVFPKMKQTQNYHKAIPKLLRIMLQIHLVGTWKEFLQGEFGGIWDESGVLVCVCSGLWVDWGKPRQWEDKSARRLGGLKAVLKIVFVSVHVGLGGSLCGNIWLTSLRSKN